MDLHGILNQNEYYTNHYFTTIFEENASDTISAWRQSAKDTETQTPWAAFRDAGKLYLRNRERYLQQKDEMGSREFIESQAAAFISALGYGEPHNETIELTDEITVPVYHEEQKANGAPLLWVLLSMAQERDDDILQGIVFGRKSEEDEEFSILLPDNNDEMLAKLFFAGTEAPRWIILVGMNQIALIDRNKWDKKKYLQFDLEEIFSRHEETTYQALAVLLHKDSLCPAEGNVPEIRICPRILPKGNGPAVSPLQLSLVFQCLQIPPDRHQRNSEPMGDFLYTDPAPLPDEVQDLTLPFFYCFPIVFHTSPARAFSRPQSFPS